MTAANRRGPGGPVGEPPCDLARLLVGKTDRHEALIHTVQQELESVRGDVGKAIAALKTLLREAAAGPTPDASVTAGVAGAEAKGQPEWLGCRDANEAELILEGVATWVEDYGLTLGVPVPQCWAWHPQWVVLLLAAAEHHTAAYEGKTPKDVSEFVTRVMPTINKQLERLLGDAGCDEHSHHEPAPDNSVPYEVRMDQIPDLAAWWATSRQGRPPGLTPRVKTVRNAGPATTRERG